MYQAYDLLIRTAGELLPPTGFDFKGKGAVTPDDFMSSGDFLIERDRRWHWVPDSSVSSLNCLSNAKQYLRAYNVPCIRLASVKIGSAEDWVVLGTNQEDSENSVTHSDVDLFEQETEHDARFYRFYDVTITYDRFYESPRIWLIGFSKLGLPLTYEEMLKDVPSVYAGRTVTIARHPCTGRMNMTIHPCCQMEAIKREVTRTGITSPKSAIPFALKIWASVLPSICLMEHDFNQAEYDSET